MTEGKIQEFIERANAIYNYDDRDKRTFNDWLREAIEFGSELSAERAKEKINMIRPSKIATGFIDGIDLALQIIEESKL